MIMNFTNLESVFNFDKLRKNHSPIDSGVNYNDQSFEVYELYGGVCIMLIFKSASYSSVKEVDDVRFTKKIIKSIVSYEDL